MSDKIFTLGSLFSGIGGLELGLEMTGRFKTVWQVEQSEYCRKVLARHWPNAQRFEDVRNVGKENLAQVDVICGGYPCQPFSFAGDRKGQHDPRHLWPEFARILREVRPQYAILENVAAHLSLGFGDVLADLADIGYDAEWTVLSACAVGAPHMRERLFVLAYSAHRNVSHQGSYHSWPNLSCKLGRGSRRAGRNWWIPVPPMDRVAHGLPLSVVRDPLHALGNAVVPQCARVIGEWLLEIDAELSQEGAA